MHHYALYAGNEDSWLRYATITELHHPEYLDLAALQCLFPEAIRIPWPERGADVDALDAALTDIVSALSP